MITPFPDEEWGDDEPRPTVEDCNRDLQDLVEKGLLDYTVDEEGEFCFSLTDEGREFSLALLEDQAQNQQARQRMNGRITVYHFLSKLNEVQIRRQITGETVPSEESWTRFEEQAETTFWRLLNEEQ